MDIDDPSRRRQRRALEGAWMELSIIHLAALDHPDDVDGSWTKPEEPTSSLLRLG